MRVHGVFVRRSAAITDRGRTEKNAQCIACQLLKGRAREIPICCKHLSTKGGSGTEGCGGIWRSRIAWLFRFLHGILQERETYVYCIVCKTLYFVTPILREFCDLIRIPHQERESNLASFLVNQDCLFTIRYSRDGRTENY